MLVFDVDYMTIGCEEQVLLASNPESRSVRRLSVVMVLEYDLNFIGDKQPVPR